MRFLCFIYDGDDHEVSVVNVPSQLLPAEGIAKVQAYWKAKNPEGQINGIVQIPETDESDELIFMEEDGEIYTVGDCQNYYVD